MLTPEVLLAFGLIGVYLFDSMHFLRIGEAVVVTRRGALYRIAFGAAFELGGRRPFVPNPLTPFWPELRADWMGPAPTSVGDYRAASEAMRERARALASVGVLSTGCAVLIVIGAPLALLFEYRDVFVVCVLLCWICVGAAVVELFLQRQELGLGVGQWLSLSLVAIVCLPCSGNLARAAARTRIWTLPAQQMARFEFVGVTDARLREELRATLLHAKRYIDEESVEFRALTEQLRRLEHDAQGSSPTQTSG